MIKRKKKKKIYMYLMCLISLLGRANADAAQSFASSFI